MTRQQFVTVERLGATRQQPKPLKNVWKRRKCMFTWGLTFQMMWNELKKADILINRNIDKLKQICGRNGPKLVRSLISSYWKPLMEVLLLKEDLQVTIQGFTYFFHPALWMTQSIQYKCEKYNSLCVRLVRMCLSIIVS